MKLGDKVIIDKILPLDSAGNYKVMKMTEIFQFESNTIPVIRKKRIPTYDKIIEDNGDIIYKIHKINIDRKTGILVGFKKKKLLRKYSRQTESDSDILVPVTRTLNKYPRSKRRLDNPYKYDTVALVALSDYKIVAVDAKDLIQNNIKII